MSQQVFEKCDNEYATDYMVEYEVEGYNGMMHSRAAIKAAMNILGLTRLNVVKTAYGKSTDIVINAEEHNAAAISAKDAMFYR